MSHFPKAQRFPIEKPSDVPGPGLYNPKLHDPNDDPWRKGPLEIFKAPRSKPHDGGPDTFGLYNTEELEVPRPRTRAISTMATPSKHANELLRLESKLFQYESQIESLNQSLKISETTVKETRKALNRSDLEQKEMENELERLRKQISGLTGIQKKLIDLENEYRKSKERRESEIGKLKFELRSLEDKSLKERNEFQIDLENAKRSSGEGLGKVKESFDRLNQHYIHYLPTLLQQFREIEDTLKTERKFNTTDLIRVRKRLGDRVAQVDELAGLVNELEWREEELVEVVEKLLEVEESAREEAEEESRSLGMEIDRLRDELHQLNQLHETQLKLWEKIELESKTELQCAQETIVMNETQLTDSRLTATALESTLSEVLKAYEELSKTYQNTNSELSKANEEIKTKDFQLNKEMDDLRDMHANLVEEWGTERNHLQSRAEEAGKEALKEKEAKRKACSELMVSRQAEAAARGELQQLEDVQLRLEAVEKEKCQLIKINDFLSRQSSLNAEEADKLASLNAELVSHQNPSQRLKVLDRIRREGKEERANLAHLQNDLWAARAEIESLKEELSSYQSISPIPTTSKKKPSLGLMPPKSPSQQLVGLSRVSRPALSEVTIHSSHHSPPPVPKVQVPSSRSAISSLPIKIASRVGMKKKVIDQSHSNSNKPNSSRVRTTGTAIVEEPAAEMSLGAIKMQGRMTLDELR
ncbi:uncharacterized protein MELLADRAFT_115449 [Melampsora larici-populina 98AG31]|uniref:Hyaluronan-mediated motility receptor C-terminal domain-containing protein n=1 Tax=Melampsora larici-populina (strain 98AG31 / pathotype 3-4-7) TaxID=747676 RepID=F4RAM4_MELLP|nr:uncharacterized protein MELLADRAFT_115449 [Melampsora larici-populina 98AG31]EGG10758.1 hypothetical protein MELLADRAFT_115449 [Melampsora larici-populina 98AG31]